MKISAMDWFKWRKLSIISISNVRILCLTVRSWDLSRNRESHSKNHEVSIHQIQSVQRVLYRLSFVTIYNSFVILSFELWWHHLWSSLYWYFYWNKGTVFPSRALEWNKFYLNIQDSFLLDFPKTKFRTHQTFASNITFTAPFV